MEQTIERVSSPWILASLPMLVAGILAAPRSLEAHISLGLIGGFTLFCLAVALPLYSSLVGGRPRGPTEWGLALASYASAAASALYGAAGGDPRPLLAASMMLALVFTLTQLRSSKVPLARTYTLPVPFMIALIALAGGDPYWSLLAYGAWFSTTLVMAVGAVFLQTLYRRPGLGLHLASMLLAGVGLILFSLGSRWMGLLLLSASLLAHIAVMRPWSGVGGRRIRAHRGHMAQALGAAASLLALLLGVDELAVAHIAMLGFATPGVYTQAPLLAPMIVSATWRRKRWIGASPMLALGAGLARPFNPHLSQALLLLSLLVLLVELNPSPHRIYYIVRYGGEEGYLKSYYHAVGHGG